MGAVKPLVVGKEEIGLVQRVGGWVESVKRVGRVVGGGLEAVGRGVRKVGRGLKWVGGKIGLGGGGGEKSIGGESLGEKVLEIESVLGAGKGDFHGVKEKLVEGESFGEKVLELESVLGAGKGGAHGVKRVEEEVAKAKAKAKDVIV